MLTYALLESEAGQPRVGSFLMAVYWVNDWLILDSQGKWSLIIENMLKVSWYIDADRGLIRLRDRSHK